MLAHKRQPRRRRTLQPDLPRERCAGLRRKELPRRRAGRGRWLGLLRGARGTRAVPPGAGCGQPPRAKHAHIYPGGAGYHALVHRLPRTQIRCAAQQRHPRGTHPHAESPATGIVGHRLRGLPQHGAADPRQTLCALSRRPGRLRRQARPERRLDRTLQHQLREPREPARHADGRVAHRGHRLHERNRDVVSATLRAARARLRCGAAGGGAGQRARGPHPESHAA